MNLMEFNAIKVQPRFQTFYPEILNFNVRNDDIWICAYPKTGTTWTEEMVWLISNNLDYEGAKKDLRLRSQFLEYSAITDYKSVYKKSEVSPIILDYLENSIKFTNQLKSQRQIKTHLPLNLLPKELRDFQKKPKIIYISRNSKDTCTSYYHFAKILVNFPENFDEFCQLFLDGNILFGSYWEHHLKFQNYFNKPNLLFIKYEDMKQDLPGIIRKVANFLDKKLTDQEIEILEKHLSFESMKNNETLNNKKLMDFCKKKYGINDDPQFIRSGKINDHKNIMSPEFIKKFDEMDQKKIANLFK